MASINGAIATSAASQDEYARPDRPSTASNGASSEGAAQHAPHSAAVAPPAIPNFFSIPFTIRSPINDIEVMSLPGLYFLK
jgi:hypothetical protein